jgi:hypothetical protein
LSISDNRCYFIRSRVFTKKIAMRKARVEISGAGFFPPGIVALDLVRVSERIQRM